MFLWLVTLMTITIELGAFHVLVEFNGNGHQCNQPQEHETLLVQWFWLII
jgi:hypothetical protein